MENETSYKTIDEYIGLYPPEVQQKLYEMRETIKKAAPEASEKITWRMPTFYLNGNLVHFAAFKSHIGFYPGAEGIEAFRQEFEREGYKYSKGAVQFPLVKPLPLELVTRIVKFRVKQNTKPEK